MLSRLLLSVVSKGVPATLLSTSAGAADVLTGDADWRERRFEYRIFSMGDRDASVRGLTGDMEL